MPEDRKTTITLINEAHVHGARKYKACELLGITLRTFERWVKDGALDQRKGAERRIANKLTKEEKQLILDTVNNAEYRDLSPC